MGELSKSSLSSSFSLSDYSSINSRFSFSDISLSASTSIPDLSSSSSCPSSNLSLDFKSRFSSESSRRTSSSHSIYWSKSSTLSTITVPFTRAPEKPPRRKQTTEEEEEHKHVICIKINQEPDTELDCANVQDVGQLSPVPLSPSPPPPPVSLTWSSLHSHANDEELPPPPQLTDFDKELSKAEASAPIPPEPEHSSWVRHIQFAVPAQVREDDDLGTAPLCYEEEHEAFNEIAEYISNSLNRKLVFKGNCGENHHLLTKLDNLKTRQRNDFLLNLKRNSFK